MNNDSIIRQNLELRKENIKLKQENQNLKKELKDINLKLSGTYRKIKRLESQHEQYVKDEELRIQQIVEKAVDKVTKKLNEEHKKEVEDLKSKISRLEKRLNTDSSNSGTPTSKNPIGKKIISNNREKSDKSIGAQKGHSINKLDYFNDEEITEIIEHTLDKCPECGGDLIETNIVKSDVIDIEIKITKTRNNIHNYKCLCCHKNVTANNELSRGVTYGNNINAIILSMMNESNTALNKITSFIKGITNNEINLCEGYLIKLQKKNADKLDNFLHNLKEKVISLKNVFWDDTIVKFGISKPSEGYDDKDLEYIKKINESEEKTNKKTRDGIIRFYGDNDWALLIGHRFKNKDGIDDDGILDNLGKECTVMHDHVLLNYNEKYKFKNAECNEHTKRYLKGIADLFPEHKWSNQMRDLLINTNEEKKELIEKKQNSFSKEKLEEISNRYDEIIKNAYKENSSVNLTYIQNKIDELNLIERLDKFKENHLMFANDFSVEFTNNTSERGLRQIKRKLAVSFMFKNANRMKDYANIISYLETCQRHGISRFEASKRLVTNNPFTIKELCEMKKKED